MNTGDFDYHLPEERIAQYPLKERDRCRLCVIDRAAHSIAHRQFSDLPSLFRPGDRLVFNDTRVLPARLFCRKETGGLVEALFTQPDGDDAWRAIVRPGRRLRAPTRLRLDAAPEIGLICSPAPDGRDGERIITAAPETALSLDEIMRRHGAMPLPPYIRRDAEADDRQDYQTVYARNPGAIAAPTAGLHFTESLLDALARAGVERSFLTLHVGIGTFRPVAVDDPRDHPMHEEWYELPDETARAIECTRARGGRVIAVGTTVARTLESCVAHDGALTAGSGVTRLMLFPGHAFRMIDGLITNFHLPRSTLLMLVCAFASRELVMEAYAQAIADNYRFYSYGDAMLVV